MAPTPASYLLGQLVLFFYVVLNITHVCIVLHTFLFQDIGFNILSGDFASTPFTSVCPTSSVLRVI